MIQHALNSFDDDNGDKVIDEIGRHAEHFKTHAKSCANCLLPGYQEPLLGVLTKAIEFIMTRYGKTPSCVNHVKPVIEAPCDIMTDSTGGKQPELTAPSKDNAAQLQSMHTLLGVWHGEGKSHNIWQVCADLKKDLNRFKYVLFEG